MNLTQYLNQRSPREQLILLAGGLICLLVLAYVLLIKPLSHNNQQLAQQVAELQATQQWLNDIEGWLSQRGLGQGSANLADIIEAVGLNPEQVDWQQGQGLQLQFPGADLTKAFALINHLEQSGMKAESIELNRRPDDSYQLQIKLQNF